MSRNVILYGSRLRLSIAGVALRSVSHVGLARMQSLTVLDLTRVNCTQGYSLLDYVSSAFLPGNEVDSASNSKYIYLNDERER